MKILFLASEVVPFSKTGGLADVSGALPAALAELGHEVLVATPLYQAVKRDALRPLHRGFNLRFPFGTERAELFEAPPSGNLRTVFIANDLFFRRPGLYGDANGDYADNHLRFGFFSMAALSAAQLLNFHPDIVHLNDWQTGLAAVALSRGFRQTAMGRAKTVFTIHNLAYQGVFPKWSMDQLGLPWELFVPNGLEFYDQLNFMKAGIAFSDALTTVSPTYAKEIQTPEGGWGLDGLLRDRYLDLHGIVNGVDVREWNPAADSFLPAPFSADDLTGKKASRTALLERFHLPDDGAPIFGMVSRMVMQKGFDVLLPALPRVLEEHDVRVIVLGTGEPRYELVLRELQQRYPRHVAVQVGYDVGLSHLIEAGSDFFLMPSQYEPCGLNQMYSLLYGTVPLVRAVGGLEDTVVDAAEPDGTGIKLRGYASQAVVEAMRRAIDLYGRPKELLEVRRRGMRQDFSWRRSALTYEELYRSLGPRNELPRARKAK